VITRRAFGGALAATLVAARRPLAAQQKLKLGIGSYTYHRSSIDEMIEQLTALKVSEIELSHGEFMLFSHPTPEKLRATRASLDKAGIACVSYYAATIKTETDIDDALRFAEILGARSVSGDATGDILSRIDARFAAAGRTFGIHNHYVKGGFPYESPDDVLKVLKGRSPALGATLDIGHIASCGYDTVDAVRRLAPHLKLVHLKDVQAKGGEVNVLLGQGIARIPEVMRALKEVRYAGLVAIEYEKEEPVDADVRTELAYARTLA